MLNPKRVDKSLWGIGMQCLIARPDPVVLDEAGQGNLAFQGLETAFIQAIAANPREGLVDLVEFISATGASNKALYGWDASNCLFTQLNNAADMGAFSEELRQWTVRFAGPTEHTINGTSWSRCDWLRSSRKAPCARSARPAGQKWLGRRMDSAWSASEPLIPFSMPTGSSQ